ncbi:MAG TPA: S8 family serine peptidase [Steroidobacteraceae bacterium]
MSEVAGPFCRRPRARTRGLRALASVLLTVGTSVPSAAYAQVLPSLPLPDVELPIELPGALPGVITPELERLAELRKVRIDALIRGNRDVIEADPKGAPIIRHELLALAPSEAALAAAAAAGYAIARREALAGFEGEMVVLLAPQGVSTRRALAKLRKLDPQGTYEYNHIYLESGAAQATQAPTSGTAIEHEGAAAATRRVHLGLIDGGVDRTHPAFSGASVVQYGCGGTLVPSAHGTAVASLLVGRTARFQGAATGAVLFAFDVYCGRPTGGAVDAIAAAFAALAREQVAVINVSLVGPRNLILERVVGHATVQGALVVAAVGNDGPHAPPLYPAAYDEVIAVTGVDRNRRLLVEAGRGEHVDFAAPGADLSAAGVDGQFLAVRGTSFAAPLVAGLLATSMLAPGADNARRAVDALAREAIDLGPRGVDTRYGKGLVGETLRVDPAVAKE